MRKADRGTSAVSIPHFQLARPAVELRLNVESLVTIDDPGPDQQIAGDYSRFYRGPNGPRSPLLNLLVLRQAKVCLLNS